MSTLDGKIALVAGATRAAGRGIALELAVAGAFVYCTGRSTRAQRSEMDRPETIEETVELIEREGGRGAAVQVDHSDSSQVEALVTRIAGEKTLALPLSAEGRWRPSAFVGFAQKVRNIVCLLCGPPRYSASSALKMAVNRRER